MPVVAEVADLGPQDLLIVTHHLRRRSTHFHLIVDLSDLRGLLFQLRGELFNLLLLFLHFAVLFEELIQQHRVYRLVAHSINFSIGVVTDQSTIYLFHLRSLAPRFSGPPKAGPLQSWVRR